MKILYFPEVGVSPAWRHIHTAESELINKGYAFHPVQSPHHTDQVLIAYSVFDEVIGFIIFRRDQVKSTYFIMLAWTNFGYRKQGVHTRLFEALVERCKAMGDIRAIESGTHINNLAAQAAFETQGRVAIAISYEFPIVDYVPGKDYLDISK